MKGKEGEIFSAFNFHPQLIKLAWEADNVTFEKRLQRKKLTQHNFLKVLTAFQACKARESDLWGTTGYGLEDEGREKLDKIYARIFGTQAALVRWQFSSGTHALACLLYGNLKPGDELLAITGKPYDTLQPLISGSGYSLDKLGVGYKEVSLTPEGALDLKAVQEALNPKTALVFLQRSCGYTWRPSLNCRELQSAIAQVKALQPETICVVDNCYGEMVEEIEPPEVGADAIAGSLIKNMGGTIAPCGGYVAGKEEVVKKAAMRLTAPGVGEKIGPTLGINRLLYQGAFFAPLVVGEALEGAIWASYMLEQLGYATKPLWQEERTDIIQAVQLGSPEALKAFCRGVQQASALDCDAHPEAHSQPGYSAPIFMAGGTFIQGSSLELSADGPLREPYAVYLQGGVSYFQVQLALLCALQELYEKGLLRL
jgi:cystathionine beta-lyase family protein involved in aluminum resistance